MSKLLRSQNMKGFFFRIVLPTMLAIVLFVLSIFILIVPVFRDNMIESKKEMINELTNSAWSILAKYEEDRIKGIITIKEAQEKALEDIQYLRYGKEKKDYFWVTDTTPLMLMHPYRQDLNNKDISDYSDPNGKKLFIEAVQIVKKSKEGYIEYMWQWKDDPSRIVPKMSYVKGFEPWGWIVGTGIYLDDVASEINALTGRLIKISLTIIFVIAILLVFIMQQSLKIENFRQQMENDLIESKSKYKMLVEASKDGTMIILNNAYVFANKHMLEILGYTYEEFMNMDVTNVFNHTFDSKPLGYETFNQLLEFKEIPLEFECQFKRKDGSLINVLLIHSKITLAGKQGLIVIVKDISQDKLMKEELGESKEKYNVLINNINVGVFRTTLGKSTFFIEMNQSARKVFGFDEKDDISKTNFFDIFIDAEERAHFLDVLYDKGSIKNKYLLLKKKDGLESVVSISAVLVKDENGENRFCDGIVEDITEQKRESDSKEKLIGELQTALLFLNEPINDYLRDVIHCEMDMSIRDVAVLMTKNKYGTIIIKAENDKYIGIVTDRDFKERAIAAGVSIESPIYEIMTSPLVCIPQRALIYEAILMMHEKGVKHLAVKSSDGKVRSVLSYEKLLDVQMHSSSFLIKEINNETTIDGLKKPIIDCLFSSKSW